MKVKIFAITDLNCYMRFARINIPTGLSKEQIIFLVKNYMRDKSNLLTQSYYRNDKIHIELIEDEFDITLSEKNES